MRRWSTLCWRQPATRTYAAILAANALWLRSATGRLEGAALRAASTNLDHLARTPVTVLVTSACWSEPGGWRSALTLIGFLVLIAAPVEAWLGTWRWVVAFAAGHVGATLLVAGGLWTGIREGWVSHAVAHSIDVGWSYGGITLAALLTFRLPRRWAGPYLALLTLTRLAALRAPTFTEWGHLAALAIGLGLGLTPLVPRARRPARAGATAAAA